MGDREAAFERETARQTLSRSQARILVEGNLERAASSPFFKNLKLFGASIGFVTLSWFMATGPLYQHRVDAEWAAKNCKDACIDVAFVFKAKLKDIGAEIVDEELVRRTTIFNPLVPKLADPLDLGS